MSRKLNRILCIDDDEDILFVTSTCLETVGGFEVLCSRSGQEGVARACDSPPDIILLDVMMPQMDGPSTLKEIRRHSELDAVPVVFMTARVQPSEIEHYKKIGAVAVLPKPFNPMTISNDILKIWEQLHG